MSEQISIDEAVEAALNPVEFKDDVIRRTEERLKANLDKTMAEFKNDLALFFAIKDAMTELQLPDIEVGPASEEKQCEFSTQLPGICCNYTAKQDGFECQGVLRLAYPEGRSREFYINGSILSDDAHRYETCMCTVYINMGHTIADVPQIINDFRTQLLRVLFDHELRNRKDR